MTRLPLTLVFALMLGGALHGQKNRLEDAEIEAQMPQQIGVLIECVTAGRQQVHELLAKHRAVANDSSLRRAVEGLIRKGSASVTELAYVVTRSGIQAQVESVVEIMYPTAWEPPEISQELRGPLEDGNVIVSPATPTSFQTRDIGLSLKVTPRIGPNPDLIDLDLDLRAVNHMGNDAQGDGLAQIQHARFHSKEVIQQLAMVNGQVSLVGILSPPENAAEQQIMVFVKPRRLPLTHVERARQLWHSDPPAKPSKETHMITTIVEYIQVPIGEIRRLLRQPSPSIDATAMRQTVGELVKTGVATIVETAFSTTKSGQRSRVRSGEEHVYGVEFDPPELPQKLQGPLASGVDVVTPSICTTIEMRPIGLELELDPRLGADKTTIELSLAPSITEHAGEISHGQGKSQVKMPLFKSRRLSTNTILLSGDTLLLGVHSNRTLRGKNTGHYTLVFLTAQAKKVIMDGDE